MKTLHKIRETLARKEILVIIVISFLGGFLLRGGGHKDTDESDFHIHETGREDKVELWKCSMHPQILLPESGICPICGMELIPVTSGSDEEVEPRELKLSPGAVKLAGIQTAPVERRFAEKEIRMAGKIAYDETGVGYITAWLPGRIDRLYVNYTGIPVRKGDHMAEIYSPDLYAAQEELIQALRAVKELKNSKLTTVRDTALRTVESSREKLRLLGLTGEQIDEFEERGKPADHITIYSPMEGIVIHKNAAEGIYVTTGTKIYTIADLSKVWIMLDVYESDLEWIRYGQDVEFHTEAYPGETFKGKIAFIDPVLNDRTRTVKIRVNVPNKESKLKPDMFVKAIVYSSVASGGKVMDPSLAGKYISPMHPEIVKDKPGTCDICGMPLVKAESLGYANPGNNIPPLVSPASAPLITGKRAVVYVSVPEREGVFEGREIVLGPRAGDYYLVESGISEGEMVVVNGNFKIDSAVQILANPSMMNPEGGMTPAVHHHGESSPVPQVIQEGSQEKTGHEHDHSTHPTSTEKEHSKTYEVPPAFTMQLDRVFDAYFSLQNALSHDSVDNALTGSKTILEALNNVDMSLVTGEAHMAWMNELSITEKQSKTIAGSRDIASSRQAFQHLSQSVIRVAEMFGTSGKASIYRFHCPMADDNKGADWLQNKSDLENPYYGSSMFKCGDLVDTLSVGN